MTIPPFDRGLLPEGVHECTLEELDDRFARPQRSDRRIRLFKKLVAYLDELRSAGVATHVIVDGSFVTDKDEPNDVDLVVVLRPDVDLSKAFRPFEENVIRRSMVRKRYGDSLDPKVARPESGEYADALDLFFTVRGDPSRRKGLLLVRL